MDIDSPRFLISNRQPPALNLDSIQDKQINLPQVNAIGSINEIQMQLIDKADDLNSLPSPLESSGLPEDPNFSQQLVISQSNDDIVTISSAQMSDTNEEDKFRMQKLNLE